MRNFLEINLNLSTLNFSKKYGRKKFKNILCICFLLKIYTKFTEMNSDLDIYRRRSDLNTSSIKSRIADSPSSYSLVQLVSQTERILPCFSHIKDHSHPLMLSFMNGAKKGAQIIMTLCDKVVYVKSKEYLYDAQRLTHSLPGYKLRKSYSEQIVDLKNKDS